MSDQEQFECDYCNYYDPSYDKVAEHERKIHAATPKSYRVLSSGYLILVLVVLGILGIGIVGAFINSQQQSASEQQQQQIVNSIAQQFTFQLPNQQQNNNLIGATSTSLAPGGNQTFAEYLISGQNVELELEGTGTSTNGVSESLQVCFSLATPSGTWLVGSTIRFDCVNSSVPYYNYDFVAPQTGYYSLTVNNPSTANSNIPLQVGIQFLKN